MRERHITIEDMFLAVHERGSTVPCIGDRGTGKSHFMTSLMTAGLAYDMQVITNIVFMEKVESSGRVCSRCNGEGRVKKRLKEGTRECQSCQGYGRIWKSRKKWPDGIHHIEYVSDLFKKASEILMEEPVTIMVVWDEIQNSAMDHHAKKDGLTHCINTLQGDQRKWNFNNVIGTPVLKNVPARVREYSRFHYFKSPYLTKEYNRTWGTDHHAKKGMIFLKAKDYTGIREIIVGEGPYNRPWNKVRKGEIIYDHESSARLALRNPRHPFFSLESLVSVYAGETKQDFPTLVYAWYEMNEVDEEEGAGNVINCQGVAEGIIESTGGWVKLRARGKRDKQWIKLTPEAVCQMSGVPDKTMRKLWDRWERQGIIMSEQDFFSDEKY